MMNTIKKSNLYRLSSAQVRSKVSRNINVIATLANTTAILKERFPHFFWVGIYFLVPPYLILGPFQGPPACMRLNLDEGACATVVKNHKSIIIPDVNLFPGHVTCDNRSKSEIVIPLLNSKKEIIGVLDVDSQQLNSFNKIDLLGLEAIGKILEPIWNSNQEV